MDNLEKVEQLAAKTGCSYEEAKLALESCGWDMIDAIIKLEQEGRIVRESSNYSSGSDATRVEAEVLHGEEADRIRPEGFGSQSGSYNSSRAETKQKTSLWEKIKNIMLKNRMIVIGRNGGTILDLPIIMPVIALIFFFWGTVMTAVVTMFFGCRYHFEGQDFGKTNINSTMDKATDAAENIARSFRQDGAPQSESSQGEAQAAGEEQNGRQDTDN